jgi:hypothetical protein
MPYTLSLKSYTLKLFKNINFLTETGVALCVTFFSGVGVSPKSLKKGTFLEEIPFKNYTKIDIMTLYKILYN